MIRGSEEHPLFLKRLVSYLSIYLVVFPVKWGFGRERAAPEAATQPFADEVGGIPRETGVWP